MDDLVNRSDLVDGALVKAVTAALPGESIERVLDETRRILIQRGLNYMRAEVAVVVEDLKKLGYCPEDIKIILNLFLKEPDLALEPPSKTQPRCFCFLQKR